MINRIIMNKRGFTLIELIVVIAILGVLAAVLVPTIGGYTTKARKASAESDGATIYEVATRLVALNNNDDDADNDILDSDALADALIAEGYDIEAADDGPIPEDEIGITVHLIDNGDDTYTVVVWSQYLNDDEDFYVTFPASLHETMAASDDED
jgi:type IV pilus assembly protein PilA